MATSNGRLAFVTEVTPGVTPATPAFQLFDFTSETLAMTGNTIRSNTVSPSRVVKKARRTSSEVGGTINFELMKGSEIDTMLAAVLGNTFSGSPLTAKAGGATMPSFTWERQLSASMYRRFTGWRASSLALNITPEQYVTAALSGVGHSQVTGTTAITDSTYANAATAEKLTALDVATIALSNGITGSFDFESIALTIDNQLSLAKRVGASPVRGVLQGQALITGELRLYVDNNDFADAFIAGTTFDMSIPLLFSAEGYTLNLQNTVITDYSDANPGNGQSWIATVPFECTLDDTYTSSFGISKTS